VRILFDLFSVLVLTADLTLIPYVLAFAVPSNHRYVTLFIWATAIFWTADILMVFNTGFFRGGVKEMNRWTICKHYLGSWFILDAMIVVCDWLSIVLTFADESLPLKLLRFLKLGRMLRVAGMLRIARLVRMYEDSIEWCSSGSFVATTRVVGMLCVSLWVIHVLGCIFYYVGTLEGTDTGLTWLSTKIEVDGQHFAYRDLDKTYLYWSAFHWSMAQITLGASELVAFNTYERVLSVVLMLVGLLFGSTLVSSLSATLIGIQMRASEHSKLARDIDRYLHQHQVSLNTANLVRKSALSRLTRPKKLMESDIPTLRQLPAGLLLDLKLGIYQKHLMKYPFFRLISSLTPEILPDLCQCATHLVVQPGDGIFKPGAESNSVHYVFQGLLRYVQEPMTSTVIRTQCTVVEESAWVSEAAFWTKWLHVGSLHAWTECELITFAAPGVVEVLVKDRVIKELSCAYALQFHQCVCEARPPLLTWPTDLVVPRTEFCEIVSRLGQDLRTSGIMRRSRRPSQSNDLESISMESQGSDMNVEHPVRP